MSKEKRYKKVGLALGSGGWRGLAHLGVIKVLVKHGIPIDYIAGSSVGALVGGMYDALENIDKVEEVMMGMGYRDLFRALSDPMSGSGILKGEKAMKFLRKYIGEKQIEDLKIPFGAVTTDLLTAETVVIKKGDLVEAIRASTSVPFIFEPVRKWGRLLVDGGTSAPIPVEIVKEMGAEMVIAVNLYEKNFPVKEEEVSLGKLGVVQLSYHLVLCNLARRQVGRADVVVSPEVSEKGLNMFLKFVNNGEAVVAGEEAAEKMMGEIKKLIEY